MSFLLTKRVFSPQDHRTIFHLNYYFVRPALISPHKNDRISPFCRFPFEQDRCQHWLELLGLEGFSPRNSNMVCSAHFAEDQYKQTKARRLLRADANPRPVEDSLK